MFLQQVWIFLAYNKVKSDPPFLFGLACRIRGTKRVFDLHDSPVPDVFTSSYILLPSSRRHSPSRRIYQANPSERRRRLQSNAKEGGEAEKG